MNWLAALAIVPLYGLILGLHVLLPARQVDGYVRDAEGKPLRYRLNGIFVLGLTVALWAGACHRGWLAWDALYLHRVSLATGACVVGFLFTLGIVMPAPRVPGWPLGKELFLGRAANPQALGGRIDAKMFLYLVGAVMLELNLLSYAAFHLEHFSRAGSVGTLVYTGLFTFFVVDYLTFERVHLYTYDFVAENVGFKLGWGCLVFYPFFYAVGLWTVADRPNPGFSTPAEVGVVALFFAGWTLARGANLQKFWFKTEPTRRAFGVITPLALVGKDGQRVLVNGFWGLSRHVNYLGELCMATALALSLGVPWALGPWLYPLYYLALLIPRQLDDDRRCAAKYGPLWDEYRRRVPRRIIPFLY